MHYLQGPLNFVVSLLLMMMAMAIFRMMVSASALDRRPTNENGIDVLGDPETGKDDAEKIIEIMIDEASGTMRLPKDDLEVATLMEVAGGFSNDLVSLGLAPKSHKLI